MLDDIQPNAREPLAAALAERFAVPPELPLDGVTSVTDALIQDIQAQIAPLADSSITPMGRSYLDELGIDADRFTSELPIRIVQSIQQVAVRFPALHPLSEQINADLILARVDQVLQVLRTATPASSPHSPSIHSPSMRVLIQRRQERQQRMAELLEPVYDAILAVPSMSDPGIRASILSGLRPGIRDAISRSPVTKVEVINTIRTCLNFSGGLRELIVTIRTIEGDSRAMADLDATILKLGELIDVDD